MSRSNGPLSQLRGGQQQWQPAAQLDPAVQQALAAAQAAAARQARPPQAFGNVQPPQGYPASPPAGYPQAEYQDQGYAPPQQPDPGYGQPHHAYQPVFDRYAPPPEPQVQAYDPRLAPARPAPAPPQPQYQPVPQPAPYANQMRGGIYDQWPATLSPQPAVTPPQQGRNYDFGHYMPGQQPAPAGHHAPAPQPMPAHQPQYYAEPAPHDQWQHGAGGEPHGGYPHAAAGQPVDLDAQGYAAQGGELAHHADQDYADDDLPDYEEDEPRRSRRGLVMVSALIGAIALGGGLAYAYKRFVGKPDSVQVAKISAPKGPSKTEPTDRGGKQFPNQDSKLQNRLGDGTPAPQAGAATSSSDVDGGVKRVQTYQVGRDGSVAPSSGVPGMVVVQPPGAVAPPAPAVPQAVEPPAVAVAVAAPPAVPEVQVAPPTPRVTIAPRPKMVNAAAATEEPEPAPAPAVKKAAKKAAAARDDLVATRAPAPAAARGGTSGFVAVLASKGSRAEAQRANTELEQRYDVLKGKIFDVQEANLTAQGKGIYYRSVVGPPGSRDYANGVCSQLKAAGHTDCWITAY